MKKYIGLALILFVFSASHVGAERLTLLDTNNGYWVQAKNTNTYYVGAVGGTLGGTRANYYCDDFSGTASIGTTYSVMVSTLSSLNHAKFQGTDALRKYQQVGWLMYQLEINPLDRNRTAAIQFAMWSVFTSMSTTFEGAAAWLDASSNINASSYDFSQMRIYTTNVSGTQEFIGGSVTAVPEPAEWMLLIIGLGLITYSVYRNREKGVIQIRA